VPLYTAFPRRRRQYQVWRTGRPVFVRIKAGEVLAENLRIALPLDALGTHVPARHDARRRKACRLRNR
jgi:hypothetical protein